MKKNAGFRVERKCFLIKPAQPRRPATLRKSTSQSDLCSEDARRQNMTTWERSHITGDKCSMGNTFSNQLFAAKTPRSIKKNISNSSLCDKDAGQQNMTCRGRFAAPGPYDGRQSNHRQCPSGGRWNGNTFNNTNQARTAKMPGSISLHAGDVFPAHPAEPH